MRGVIIILFTMLALSLCGQSKEFTTKSTHTKEDLIKGAEIAGVLETTHDIVYVMDKKSKGVVVKYYFILELDINKAGYKRKKVYPKYVL